MHLIYMTTVRRTSYIRADTAFLCCFVFIIKTSVYFCLRMEMWWKKNSTLMLLLWQDDVFFKNYCYNKSYNSKWCFDEVMKREIFITCVVFLFWNIVWNMKMCDFRVCRRFNEVVSFEREFTDFVTNLLTLVSF